MKDPVTTSLEQFQEKDITVRVCRLLFGAIPKAPPFVFYQDLQGAVGRLGGSELAELPPQLGEITRSEACGRTLWVADKLDIADATLATYSGVSNVFAWVSGGRTGGHFFESDKAQAIDAVLKVIGASYMINKLFEGTVKEKFSKLLELPAGKEMILYLCIAEIALPFFDNVVAGGWTFASKHLQSAMGEGASKFSQVTGEKATEELKGTFNGMSGLLGQAMGSVQGHLGPIVQKLDTAMPKILNVTDSVTGMMATALDALPVWRFLGARLAAEAAAQQAGVVLTPVAAGDPFGQFSWGGES